LGVGGNDVPKNAPLTLMKYKCFLCGIPKARKTCKNFTGDDFPAVTNVLTAVCHSCVPNFLLLLVFPLLASLVDAAWLSAACCYVPVLAGVPSFTDSWLLQTSLLLLVSPLQASPLAVAGDSVVAGFLL
jgi:hypothetical protein